jgi:hypothetical protein
MESRGWATIQGAEIERRGRTGAMVLFDKVELDAQLFQLFRADG